MEHAISTRWLANPNQGHSHFPHDYRCSYAYLIQYQGEDSHSHQILVQFSPIMLTIVSTMVITI